MSDIIYETEVIYTTPQSTVDYLEKKLKQFGAVDIQRNEIECLNTVLSTTKLQRQRVGNDIKYFLSLGNYYSDKNPILIAEAMVGLNDKLIANRIDCLIRLLKCEHDCPMFMRFIISEFDLTVPGTVIHFGKANVVDRKDKFELSAMNNRTVRTCKIDNLVYITITCPDMSYISFAVPHIKEDNTIISLLPMKESEE